jgi:hydroxymethylpyrimidine pyrophosphatase-like HAD family hydrolase
MANADERLKKAARFVTAKTNDDDGIADLVGRCLLGNEPLPVGSAGD